MTKKAHRVLLKTMHGIQHLFRQHAIEKQTSTDSWHSTYSNGRSISANDSNSDLKSSPWNQGIVLMLFSHLIIFCYTLCI